MLPLWIIDLEENDALRGLLAKMASPSPVRWKYTFLPYPPAGQEDEDALFTWMEHLAEEGQQWFNQMMKEGGLVGNFQIAILGNALEGTTQTLFALLPGLLRDYMSRVIASHANLGLEITGFLFISSQTHQSPSQDFRQRTALFLEEVNMAAIRAVGRYLYDQIVSYQDIQYEKERFYPALDETQRMELLFQYLINCYFHGQQIKKPFDRSQALGQTGCELFSLGAASLYYDSAQHIGLVVKSLIDRLLIPFKKEDTQEDPAYKDDAYAARKIRTYWGPASPEDPEPMDPDQIEERLLSGCGSTGINYRKMEGKADPHPVWDLMMTELFPSYYRKYLKYMPARLRAFMDNLSYALSLSFSSLIRKNREAIEKDMLPRIYQNYRYALCDPGCPSTLAQVESFFEQNKQYLEARLAGVAQDETEVLHVPEFLRTDYNKCKLDEESNSPEKILDKLKKTLEREPVILSAFVRCFLLGVVTVFTGIPLLRLFSPKVFNFGDVAKYEWIWILVLFFLPLAIEFLIKIRRHFKRIRRLKYRYLAHTLLMVNRKLTDFLFNQMRELYHHLIEECDRQKSLVALFRQELHTEEVASSLPLPATLFNQSLLTGQYQGGQLVEDRLSWEGRIDTEKQTLPVSMVQDPDALKFLLQAFRTPDCISSADLSSLKPEEMAEAAGRLVQALSSFFKPKIHLTTATDLGLMLQALGDDVELAPFFKMAGLNGMLFDKPDANRPLLSVSNPTDSLANAGFDLCADPATEGYMVFTRWQRLSKGILSQSVCGCHFESVPTLRLSDKMVLYYCFYRQNDRFFRIGNIPVSVDQNEMDRIDRNVQIRRKGK